MNFERLNLNAGIANKNSEDLKETTSEDVKSKDLLKDMGSIFSKLESGEVIMGPSEVISDGRGGKKMTMDIRFYTREEYEKKFGAIDTCECKKPKDGIMLLPDKIEDIKNPKGSESQSSFIGKSHEKFKDIILGLLYPPYRVYNGISSLFR